MKAVMFSIKPNWCHKILTGYKKLEVRKRIPTIKPPFKCYIYCSDGETLYRSIRGINIALRKQHDSLRKYQIFNKRVIGEFTCDAIIPIFEISGSRTWLNLSIISDSCLSEKQIIEYAGKSKEVYGLHISNFILYDQPKSISDFALAGICRFNKKDNCTYNGYCIRAGKQTDGAGHIGRCGKWLDRPPQSWCYVEDLQYTEES